MPRRQRSDSPRLSLGRRLPRGVGSSSLKAVLYRLGAAETVVLRVSAERIGTANSRLRVVDAQGEVLHQPSGPLPDHPSALASLFTHFIRSSSNPSAVSPPYVSSGCFDSFSPWSETLSKHSIVA